MRTEQEAAQDILQDRGSRFLEFLSAVARTYTEKPPQQLEKSSSYLLSSQIPDLPNLITVGPTAASNSTWLSIRRCPTPDPVHVPQSLKDYVNPATIRKTTNTPALKSNFDKLLNDDSTEESDLPDAPQHDNEERAQRIRLAFADWKATTWQEWVERTRPLESARDLYQKLFDLYVRLDQDSEYYELVFGHGILTWYGRHKTDYPLLITNAHIVFHEDNGTISIQTNGISRMSVAAFDNNDLPGYPLLKDYVETVNENPVDVWDQAAYAQWEKDVISRLGIHARINAGLDLVPTEFPSLQHGWTLLLRKKANNSSLFYNQLAKKLQHEDFLPIAFDSIFSDAKTIALATGGNSADDGTAEHLLMPLPANAEQEQIAQQFAHSAGVTVQGPPGTGKSHTIVNLISHLLAQGKRILVTAEKEQALTVLQDKIPEQIRDLSIAFIGNSAEDNEKLRISVQRMQDSISNLNSEQTHARLRSLDHELDAIRSRSQEVDEQLTTALIRESGTYDLPDGRKTASEVAQWLTANAQLDIIPDTIAADASLPLSEADFHEYVHLCRALDKTDIEAASKNLPDLSGLPSPAELSELVGELERLHDITSRLEEQGLDLDNIDRSHDNDLQQTLQKAKHGCEILQHLDGDWERQLGPLMRDNHTQCARTMQNINLLLQHVQQCLDLGNTYLGHIVNVPDGDATAQLDLLQQWKERVDQHKGLPRVFNKELREFATQVTVDGYQPQTSEQISMAIARVQERALRNNITVLITQTFAGLPAPDLTVSDGNIPLLADTLQRMSDVIAWWSTVQPDVDRSLRTYFPDRNPAADLHTLQSSVSILESSAARSNEQDIHARIATWTQSLQSHCEPQDSPLWSSLCTALQALDIPSWANLYAEVRRLTDINVHVQRLNVLHNLLSQAAPQWSDAIQTSSGSESVTGNVNDYALIWELAKAHTWITDNVNASEIPSLLDRSQELSRQYHAVVLEIIDRSARLHLKETQDPDERRALNTWLDAVKKYGKGTGKNASNYLLTARHELPKAMNAMPVWIMPLGKVMDNFDPATSNPFDVIIVDESSQCDLLSVGVLALANKAIIVGDDKQTSPTGSFKSISSIVELQNKYIPDIQGKSLLTMDESLYALSNRTFQSQIMLREHFRCVPEIIDYSNRFYDNQIFPLRERTHPEIGSPLQAVYVPNAVTTKISGDSVNEAEMHALVDQVERCCMDPRYDGMTFGVVTMMSGRQKDLITEALIASLGAEEFAKRKLRVGNPPAFQGDERNVIFLSFIADAAGSHAHVATKEWEAQWMNVAASRAQDQLWAFYSFDLADLSPKDYRRGLIEYIRDTHVDDNVATDVLGAAQTHFEHDLFNKLVDLGYGPYLQPHYRVGRYTIDCVITVAPGLRLALECDGDERKQPDDFANDIAKQHVLERLGWRFIRISAPAFYLDAQSALASAVTQIQELEHRKTAMGLTSIQANRITATVETTDAHSDETAPDNGDSSSGQKSSHTIAPPNNEIVTNEVDPDGIEPEPAQSASNESAEDMPFVVNQRDSAADRQNNDAFDASRPYVLTHGSLLTENDLPEKKNDATISEWLRPTVQILIDNEYPLSFETMYNQFSHVFRENGFTFFDAHQLLNKALQSLENDNLIICSYDNYYYPSSFNKPFKVIIGRVIRCISVTEFEAVIRILCNTSKKQSDLFNDVMHLYRIQAMNTILENALNQSIKGLVNRGDLRKQGDLIFPTEQLMRSDVNPVAFFTEELKREKAKQNQNDTLPSPAEKSPSVGKHVATSLGSSPDFSIVESEDSAESIDKEERHSTARSITSSAVEPGTHRKFTTYGEQYGLKYIEPLSAKDLQAPGGYPNISSWLHDAIQTIIIAEWPLHYAMLRRQLKPIILRLGGSENQIDTLLHDAIKKLQSEKKIFERSDFLYPADQKLSHPSITRHREINVISNREIMYVMQTIIQQNPGHNKSFLLDEVFLTYGFTNYNNKIQYAFETAYKELIDRHMIVNLKGKLRINK